MNFNEIKEKDNGNLMPTYGRFPVALLSGKGATAVGDDGRQYIDFGSGIGVNSLGYCESGWTKAVTNQLNSLQHTSNLYYTEPGALLAEKLCRLSGLDKVFLANSGAEANECAIKLARKYSFDKGNTNKNKIVTLINSFHGRTLTTLTATGQEVFHNYFFPFPAGFDYAEAGNISDLESKCGKDTCAVVMEMIQGEGGVRPQDKDFVKAAAEYCKAHDILLIIDEVQTGIGRTGTMFAYEQYGIKPDVVTLAKGLGGGLPIGACLCFKELSGVMSAGTHGSTFGGNPVVSAGANYILDTVSNPKFMKNVTAKGEYIRSRLAGIPSVKEVRGLGLMIGIELNTSDAKTVANLCLEKGLLILTAKTVLRLLPPLNISDSELTCGMDILCGVLNTL